MAADATTIDDLHTDIIAQALWHMDGPTLTAASCSTPLLRTLASDPSLWRHICLSTWPSLRHPQLLHLLSGAHRRYFSNSFPFPESNLSFTTTATEYHYHHPDNKNTVALDDSLPRSIISAIDLYHKGAPVYSRVIEIETSSPWFLTLPFYVDGLDRKDPEQPSYPAPTEQDPEQPSYPAPTEPAISPKDLTLSWVMIDPDTCRAVNVSSRRPVAVDRHWYTGGTLVRFAVVLKGCVVSMVVTCEEGLGHVREVILTVEDMDGMPVSGRESLGILKEAMEGGRRGAKWEEEIKNNYTRYLERKTERRERRLRREKTLDLCCTGFGALMFVAFAMLLAFR